ncbi:cell envelope biogenesis protein OmpA [Bradyrhizobium sp. LTSP885]|uniref:carbohydrate porin n=1 Tax=Bradyrhizobium sp. LTSP885 TaxID=1619232 RepID=UPI0005C99779|nr:carbohydrate porin [Bradyrhizobium sp. LTSP885]KJC47787.1 cell envelope biogenesis protein OmpA [Bradyrhizobium sp. LTSP885]
MTCVRLFRVQIAAGAALGAAAFGTPAAAADIAVKSPATSAVYGWTGFYIGGHIGYGDGSLGPGTNPLPEQSVFLPSTITGGIGGFQAGYNRQFANRFVLGVEADATFTSPVDLPRRALAPFNASIDYVGTVRGRIGYAFGTWMPYLTGGFAWGHSEVRVNDATGNVLSEPGQYQTGWTAGAGAEFAVGGHWTAKLEYDYIDLSRRTMGLADFGMPGVTIDPRIHLLKFGLNYQLGDAPWSATPTQSVPPESNDWNLHGQTTFIGQGYPAFRSPYAGTDSLPGGGQVQQTWTTTAFLGVRLWEGGEFYFNAETAQGFGLNGTLGIAGFPNGEAQKAGAEYPKIRPQRYYFKQTFGFGGEQEDVADGANQLAGKRDIDRLTVVVGRFAVGDFFDGNSYAKDPRADFMNWAMWSSAAYDFPADLPGYTRGAVVELNRKDWAVRAGLFQVPNAPNSDTLVFSTGGAVVEFEGRYAIFDQPGKLRVGVFGNRGNTGNYNQALAIEGADPALDINAVMAGIRKDNLKYGFYINAEQQIATDVGLFGRLSWNDGQTEILSFTDIDRSVSGGVSVKGSYWGRPNDTIGVGGAINGLSAAHRDFLAAGGLGLLIGDGALNYRNEGIFETYYAYQVNKNLTLTADYQFIANPAYNADRGPAHVISGRVHGEF